MSRIDCIKIYNNQGLHYEYDVPLNLVSKDPIKLATYLILELQESINNDTAIKKELIDGRGISVPDNN